MNTDPAAQAQAQAQGMHMMMVMFPIFLLFGLAVLALFVWLFWRIFTKAGMSGPLSLLVLVPGVGVLIAVCVLSFGQWRVVSVQQGQYPPPPLG